MFSAALAALALVHAGPIPNVRTAPPMVQQQHLPTGNTRPGRKSRGFIAKSPNRVRPLFKINRRAALKQRRRRAARA